MSFRSVPKSVTLNYLERRSGSYFALFHRIRQLPGRTAKTWLKIHRYILLRKCSSKNLVFSSISFRRYSQGIIPSECVKMRNSPVQLLGHFVTADRMYRHCTRSQSRDESIYRIIAIYHRYSIYRYIINKRENIGQMYVIIAHTSESDLT